MITCCLRCESPPDPVLVRPTGAGEPDPGVFPTWLRQRVEAIIGTLKGQPGIRTSRSARSGRIVAMLRTEAGRDPYGKALSDLVGELCTRSDEFRVRWGADPGLALVAFSADAGSPDDDALRLLASWAATHEPANAQTTPPPR